MKQPTNVTSRRPKSRVQQPPRSFQRLDSTQKLERDQETQSARRSTRFERRVLARLLRRLGNPPMSVELWDGYRVGPPSAQSRMCLRILDRPTLLRVLREPQRAFAEAYTDGSMQVEGDLLEFLRALQDQFTPPRYGAMRRFWSRIWRIVPQSVGLARARTNIYHHYDIGNQFYRLWLDERMLYTCAYYSEPDASLEQAQVAKMDHICRKLQLRPGETVIEAGCGWGGFALHMAEHYGVTVRAFNISHEQIVYARESARLAGLDHKVEFIERDWREIEGTCDAFVSVGMLEHVGVENYAEFGNVIDRCLDPSGRGLIHTIGRNYPAELSSWILQNIFPGARPPALSEMSRIFERRNFSLLDVENIRLHYAVTLKDWLDRFEWHVDEVRQMFDERFVRMWRLYLASSIVAFEVGALQLFQVLFVPGRSNMVPWTRRHVYDAQVPSERGATWDQLAQGRMS